MLVRAHRVVHLGVAFLLPPISFHDEAGDDEQEDQGQSDGERYEDDKAAVEVVS